jgi:hypothetical protein
MGKLKAKKQSKNRVPSSPKSKAPIEWTPEKLLKAIQSETPRQVLARLKRIGVLTASGEISDRYKNWGNKVTRTPDAAELRKWMRESRDRHRVIQPSDSP